jgi:putative intracellular protease/amidase
MADVLWHTERELKVELNKADLGNPDHPHLLAELLAPSASRDRRLFECYAHHLGKECKAEASKHKEPWMFVQQRRAHGRVVLRACHFPVTHKANAVEGPKHAAVKEHIAAAASKAGLKNWVEKTSNDRSVRNDVLVEGPDGRRHGCEPQFYDMSDGKIRERNGNMIQNGIHPFWVVNDDRSTLIDRGPWVRMADMPWREIEDSRNIALHGGFRHLEEWKCAPSAERACPNVGGSHACDEIHHAWFIPQLTIPAKPEMFLDRLVVGSALGEYRSLFIPGGGRGNSGKYIWTPERDYDRWIERFGDAEETTESKLAPSTEIYFSEEESTEECHSGETSRFRSESKPRRDVSEIAIFQNALAEAERNLDIDGLCDRCGNPTKTRTREGVFRCWRKHDLQLSTPCPNCGRPSSHRNLSGLQLHHPGCLAKSQRRTA